MLKIREIEAKSIITKSRLPDSNFVINPYIGCIHGCIYCYARFMKRFTGHNEPWGQFVDIKINGADLILKGSGKYKDKSITIGSVTDPYQSIERKYGITRKILEKLIPLQPSLCIITKSDLITRDVDLIKQFKDCIVAISLSTSNEKVRRNLEPAAPLLDKRLNAQKELHKEGIKIALFISPIFPEITDWKAIIKETSGFVYEYWFENLNLYPSIEGNVYAFLSKYRPELIEKYKEIYSKNNGYWNEEQIRIEEFCQQNKIKYKMYFHHK